MLCEYSGGRPYLRGIRRQYHREYVLDIASFDETITRDSPNRKIHRALAEIEKHLTPVLDKLNTRL